MMRAWTLAVLLALAASPCLANKVTESVSAELELVRLSDANNLAGIKLFMADAARPDLQRAKALARLMAGKKAPLGEDDKASITQAMTSGGPYLRAEGAKVVGQVGEQSLLDQVAMLALKDPVAKVKIVALKTLRPYTKLSHLYFLESNLNDPSDAVREESIRSIGKLKVKEIRPDIYEKIFSFTSSDNSPSIRLVALEVLHGWSRVSWELLNYTILDFAAPETLRSRAIELTDVYTDAMNKRAETLVNVVERESSLKLAYMAFRRVKTSANKGLAQGVQKFLESSGVKNSATDEMASYLKYAGVSMVFQGGSWVVRHEQAIPRIIR